MFIRVGFATGGMSTNCGKSHFSPDYDILKTIHMNLRKCQTGTVRESYSKFYDDKLYNSTSKEQFTL